MRKYIKLLLIPVSLMLAECTNSATKSSEGQTAADSMQRDSTVQAGQDTIKADPPITNGENSMPKDSN